ncbi:hypothetical protein SAMN02910353_00313 [Ruminococcus sp. YRD2003]|uniref:hypothetical protein n=1 Tax=Ruminococcus sp. YRD2003 TaxID=1452313 RepID=UPI0008CD462B|nr:hypothetical protein SAMN02910353_00313 [Ruminococcus flavefaciens]
MKVNVIGGEMSPQEIDEYIAYVGKKYPGRQLRQLDLLIDGEFVDIRTYFKDTDFQHAYRSADYLVNDMDKLNDAKQKEFSEKQRHGVGEDE